MFWLFGPEAHGILAPLPGIEPIAPAMEGEVLTAGLPGKSLEEPLFFFFKQCFFVFIIYFIYLFFAVLGLRCGVRAPHSGGFSCCGAQALGTQASVVVAHGF